MTNVYGYTRVSTARQGTGVSLEVQKEAIARYAASHDLTIVQWFEEQETAAKQGRPIFTEMMNLLKRRKSAGVIMHKIDRSARNLGDWVELKLLAERGIQIHFVTENINLSDPIVRLSADIQAVVSSDYIRNLKEEAKKGIYGRIQQGIFPFQAPTGYKDNGKGKCKTIDPVQGPLVRKAFELYATGTYTYETLTSKMRSLGLKNIKGRPIALTSFTALLSNLFYIGIIKVKGTTYDGKHEPLISISLFNQVQAVIKGKLNQKTLHNFQFRKMIKCAHCNYSIIGEVQKNTVYYRCQTKGCPTKSIRESALHNDLKALFHLIEFTPNEMELLNEELDNVTKNAGQQQKILSDSMRLQVSALQTKLERLTECFIDGQIEKEIYDRQKVKVLMNLKEREHMLSEINAGKGQIFDQARKFLELSKTLIESYKNGNPDERRELVKIVTSNLTLDRKKLEITMTSPFFEMANRHSVLSGGPIQDRSRKMTQELAQQINISRKPLPKKKLKALLHTILNCIKEKTEH